MSTWGPGAFENDAALEWLAQLDGANDTSPLQTALMAVIDEEEHLAAHLCQPAIAAAEVVASMAGWPGDLLHEPVFDYVQRMQRPSPALVRLALDALGRVKQSELRSLGAEWLHALAVLEQRLAA